MRSFTWQEVRRLRMARSHLTKPFLGSIAQLARDLGGIHAQVMSAAETSIAVRTKSLTAQDVKDALWAQRTVVKAWTLRGTLHLHPSDELSLWLAARSAVTPGFHDRTLGFHGVTVAQLDEMTHAVAEALDGKCLLRKELADAVSGKLGEWAREPLMSAWGTMLGLATIRGWLCHGPPRGSSVTFVRADQWIPNWTPHDQKDALREVAKRYVSIFGPTTHTALQAWFNAPNFKVADARRVFGEIGDELEAVEVEGAPAWMLKTSSVKPSTEPEVRFLPLYDCYLVGFRERTNLLTDAAVSFAKTHPKGRLEGPVAVQWLLIDGMVDGAWTKTAKGKQTVLEVTPFRKTTPRLVQAVEKEAGNLERIWSSRISIRFNNSL